MTPAPASDGWQLGGNSPAAYEQYLVPKFFAPWAEALLDLVEPAPGERVLDVACGTGIVARCAAGRVGPSGTVVGLDLNPAMLEAAGAAAAPASPAIEWRSGNATELPFPGGSFDVVCCQQALQFFPDRAAALREMHRVLVPNGCLGLNILRPIQHNPSYIPLAAALERHAGAEAASMMRSPFPAWDADALRDLVASAGFRDPRVRLDIRAVRFPSPGEFLRQEAASSPLAGPIGALSAEAREGLIADLTETLRAYTDDEGIVFPMETYLVMAHR